jgi:hypothetical protein
MQMTIDGSHKWSTNIKDYRVVREVTSITNKVTLGKVLKTRYHVERKQGFWLFASWTKIGPGDGYDSGDAAIQWILTQCQRVESPAVDKIVLWRGSDHA